MMQWIVPDSLAGWSSPEPKVETRYAAAPLPEGDC
jgi:hypothetical protein